jgi:uncharacterized protein
MAAMQEIFQDGVFAFTDREGTFALDIATSRVIKSEASLDQVAARDIQFPSADKPAYRPLDYMRTQLCVTHSCNLACLYCKLDGEHPAGNMGLATAKKAMEHILARRPAHARKIVVSLTSNGETLVNYDTIDALIPYCNRIARDAHCSFSFNFATNGTLLDRTTLRRILRHDNLTIFFSLDGRKEEQNRLRPYQNGGDSYGDVMAAIDLYRQETEGMPSRQLASSTVITLFNLDIPGIYRKLVELGFTNILTRPVRGRPDWDFALNERTLAAYKEAYSEFYEFLKRTVDLGETIYLESMTPAYDFFGKPVTMLMLNERRLYGCPHSPPAGSGFDLKDYSITYDADGSIICPCRDVIGIDDFRIGALDAGIDISTLTGITGWTCETRPECTDCWARYLCGGGCYLMSYYSRDHYSKPDAVACDLTRHVIKLGMKFAVYLENNHPALYEKLKDRAMSRLPWHSIYGR